jgi:hypothetical protein
MLKKKRRIVEDGTEGLMATELFYALVASFPLPTGSTYPKASTQERLRQNPEDRP